MNIRSRSVRSTMPAPARQRSVYESANAPVYAYDREGKVIRIDHSNYD